MREPSNRELKAQAKRLALTWKINRLKKEKNAVIPGHVYQKPEILQGIADFTGDSYRLASLCSGTKADKIVFCGVRFMAETAKILNPAKEVYLPSPDAGCSLAESITGEDVRGLKVKHPGAPVVSYINTSVETKAESDCIVTSANAEKILRKLYKKHKKIIFLPDKLMGANLARLLGKTPGRDIILWKGTCNVHEDFNPRTIAFYRKANPGIHVLAHSECEPRLIKKVDFMGGTGGMMDYVRSSRAPAYLLVTECGFVELAQVTFPDKNFIACCRLCSHMKLTDLTAVLRTLEKPAPEQKVVIDPGIAGRARRSIEKMFELAESPERESE